MFEYPVTKERFLELAAAAGCNRYLASDLWYFRPRNKSDEPEEVLELNFGVMKAEGWIGRNNPKAEAMRRHTYERGNDGRCKICDNNKRIAAHNTELLQPDRLLFPLTKEPNGNGEG